MTHRFFLPPEAFHGDGIPESVIFPGPIAHQLKSVLRMRPGARAIVLDGRGWEYEVELIAFQGSQAAARVCERREAASEPRVSLVLYQGMLKGQHFEWVLQKGTELGVSVFVPIETRRSVARSTERWASKRARLERIIREAAEQSGRGRLPRLADPLSFSEACREAAACDLALIPTVIEPGHRDAPPTVGEPGHRNASSTAEDAPAAESVGRSGLAEALRALEAPPQSVALLIGSEGGFQEDEVELALRHTIRAVTLGPRVLRAETAALVAAAIVLSELGEMS
jgi:16S rRNA (uracil1498-N3)-methyltransferase